MLQPAETAERSAPKYSQIEELLDRTGIQIPEIFLPNEGVDLKKWAVVACDQYTSQPEYWSQVAAITQDQPSTLQLTLPEIYLGKPDEMERIQAIQANMKAYLEQGILLSETGMMYVERSVNGKQRKGIVLCLDLERYNYTKGSQSLIRATEGTIVDRLPPRMKIREGAVLEFPHILVLIDDPERTVIEPLSQAKDRMELRYDFDLMLDSGHLTGYQITDSKLEFQVIEAINCLADPQAFKEKYGLEEEQPILLYAMGDGNHSLATAKAIWEKNKSRVGMNHPSRYALVEIENVHDEGLAFEPIHRVLFGFEGDLLGALRSYYGKERVSYVPCQDCVEMMERMANPGPGTHGIGLTFQHQYGLIEISNPDSNLAVGSLQPFLDQVIEEKRAKAIDYVHGKCVICKLTASPNNYGFYLPNMAKSDLFKTVILDGALPRKTFSMGEAHEKRFYMEGRKIA